MSEPFANFNINAAADYSFTSVIIVNFDKTSLYRTTCTSLVVYWLEILHLGGLSTRNIYISNRNNTFIWQLSLSSE